MKSTYRIVGVEEINKTLDVTLESTIDKSIIIIEIKKGKVDQELYTALVTGQVLELEISSHDPHATNNRRANSNQNYCTTNPRNKGKKRANSPSS